VTYRRVVTRLGVAVALGWILLIVGLIFRQPPGEPDPAALAAAASAAFREHDTAGLQRLLASSPADAATRLLAACGGAVTGVRIRDDARVELVTAAGGSCAALPISDHDGRWYIDAWALPG
jgi:hypothetical protein